jgi:hypothetical protein
MTVAIPTIGARSIEPKPDPRDRPDTYPKGRRCALGACGCDEGPVELSIYNPNETCSVCTPKIARLVRTAIR